MYIYVYICIYVCIYSCLYVCVDTSHLDDKRQGRTLYHHAYIIVVCCSVLQCVAVCCSVLQCVAVCCSV